MTGSASSLLERFQLARLSSLPQLLLGSPCLQPSTGAEAEHAAWLAGDPALYLKLLGNYRHLLGDAGLDAGAALRRLDGQALDSLVQSSALLSLGGDGGGLRQNFLKRQWRQALRCAAYAAALAEALGYPRVAEARICGLLMNCGELLFENILGGQYLELHRQAASANELRTLERERFGAGQAELGAGLLRRWNLDPFLCDSLLYQDEAAEDLRDAFPLLRLAWLARRLAEDKGPEALAAAGPLMPLDSEALAALRSRTEEAIERQEQAFGLRFATYGRFPLSQGQPEDIAAEDEVARLQLQHRMENLSLFNALRPGGNGAEGGLSAAVAGALGQLFGVDAFVLFAPDPKNGSLAARAARPSGSLTRLRLKTAGNLDARSAVLRCFQSGERQQLAAGDNGPLPVVDRQLLALLGSQRLLCEPLREDGRVRGVLVLGFDAGGIDHYLDQVLIAPRLLGDLARLLRPASPAGAGDLLRRQELREIVHEVNNPLSIIKNYLHLLERRQQDGNTAQEIQVIRDEIDRVAAIVGRLRQERGDESIGPVDLNGLVEKLARLFSSSILREKSLHLELRLDPARPMLESAEVPLRQILTNLVLNAAEALPEQGRITIATHALVYWNERRYIELQICDDGPGIAPEIMHRLFSYANTTKGGGHAGDGLAIVKSLVEKLGGQISCRSSGAGTVFTILLPDRTSGTGDDGKGKNPGSG